MNLYEPELDVIYSRAGIDSRFITAQSYLKGLYHQNDKPSKLMPKDAEYLTKARRFYAELSRNDQLVIDSFSDLSIMERLNLKERNRRFNELVYAFMQQI